MPLEGKATMIDTIYCLVTKDGTVYMKDGADSYSEVAAQYALDENACAQYRYDLTDRQLVVDRSLAASAPAAHSFVELRLGTPERLMKFAEEGHLPKRALAALLTLDTRQRYLDACAKLEKRYTDACAAQADPCLETGCSVEGEDEICLQPLLRAGAEYQKACAAEWLKLFRTTTNRIDVWRN